MPIFDFCQKRIRCKSIEINDKVTGASRSSFDREGRGDHIICSPKEEYLGIITAYVPTLNKWENDFRTRRRPG